MLPPDGSFSINNGCDFRLNLIKVKDKINATRFLTLLETLQRLHEKKKEKELAMVNASEKLNKFFQHQEMKCPSLQQGNRKS